jgi:hypothetical protein
VSYAGIPCGWGGIKVGDTRSAIYWQVTLTGASVLLEMERSSIDHSPYSGTMTGRQFIATSSTGSNYLETACQFKGGTLTGSFSEDLSSFQATENLVWGPPERETTVQLHWTTRRF